MTNATGPSAQGPQAGTEIAPRTSSSVQPAGRQKAAAYALYGASACLFLVAAMHGAGYVAASIAVKNSGLSPFFQNAFRALWLGFSLQALVIGGILLIAAMRPRSVSRAVLILCGLLPLISGALLALYLESVVGSLALVAAAALIVAGAALRGSASEPLRG